MIREKAPDATLTHEGIQHVCGELADWKVAKILASEASYKELKAAMRWGLKARPTLSGRPNTRSQSGLRFSIR